ncbi:hypothetical protein [Rhizorhabdus sp. FW153]|uniref:hypothetical protein n=1 Tax=Rhizorhabdus sp. FW153 TaxID=3400216 RepID=UPI003CF7F6BD
MRRTIALAMLASAPWPVNAFVQPAFELYHPAQVEVLRGPQDTLFGKSMTGSANSRTTGAPIFDPAFRGEVSSGRYHLLQLRAQRYVAQVGVVESPVSLFELDPA